MSYFVSFPICHSYGGIQYNDLDFGLQWLYDQFFLVGDPTRGTLNISHPLFAKDSLLFCEVEQNQLWVLRALLLCFEAASGLKVNFDKLELVLVGNVLNTRHLANTLGCKISSVHDLSCSSFRSCLKSYSIQESVIEKIKYKLAGWQRLYLSKCGRITLIKSTISNLPMYFLSLFHIPTSMAFWIEKLHRDFFWSGMGNDFKFHLVK